MQDDNSDALLAWALAAQALQAARKALALARLPGPHGDTGPMGPDGEPGRHGLSGIDGLDGAPGRDGRDGRDARPMLPAHVEFTRDQQRRATKICMFTPAGQLDIVPIRDADGLMVAADFTFTEDAGNGLRN